jgi:hypothetical protein
MLCLLSHLDHESPLAQLLARCMRRCLSTATVSAAGSSSSSNSGVREVLQHILLPVRFGMKMPARLWLLQQLLTRDSDQQQQQHDQPLPELAAAPDAAMPCGGGTATAVLKCLKQLLQGEGQQQLAEGLQLLVQQQQGTEQQQGAGAKAGANSSDAAGGSLSLQQTQALDLAAGMLQLVGALGASSNAGVAPVETAVAVCRGWQQQAAQQLWEVLQGAAAAAACELQPRPW